MNFMNQMRTREMKLRVIKDTRDEIGVEHQHVGEERSIFFRSGRIEWRNEMKL